MEIGSPSLAETEVLITASEAYPRLESLFLKSQRSIRMGFRLFDPRTPLISAKAREVGDTWVDLLLHTLDRGISIDLTISDFDPVMAFDMHANAWRIVSIANAVNELTRPGAARIAARCILHPAQGGLVPRLLFAPKTRKALRECLRKTHNEGATVDPLRFCPAIKPLVARANGRWIARKGALPKLFPVTLHHKMAVFDEQTTYVGGLDLNERRIDSQGHDQSAQQTWHDVQMVIPDPDIAQAASDFLRRLPDVVNRKSGFVPSSTAFCSTLSRKRHKNLVHLGPEPVNDGILQAHLHLIQQARHLIYLETQFFRDNRIAAALAKAARQNPQLQLLLVLPAAPEKAAFKDDPSLDVRFGEFLQTRALRKVRRAFGDRFLAVSPAQPRSPDARDIDTDRATLSGAPIVYVHAKVSIFDDAAAIVSSANLNGRSMKWDAETGVILNDKRQVIPLREKLFRHWLLDDAEATFYDPKTAVGAWRARANSNKGRAPDDRLGFVLPYEIRPGARASVPMPGAPEEMV